jgi:hypothetical protein
LINVPLFAPVRHILPKGTSDISSEPNIFLPRMRGREYVTLMSVNPTTVDTDPEGLAAGI